MKSVGFVSLGCAKNLVDSEHMASVLRLAGFGLVPAERADVVVVNTCAFIGDARAESLRAVREACAMKESGRCEAVIVAGCMPQRYRRRLAQSMPGVDAFIGLDDLDRIGDVARRISAAGNSGAVRWEVSRTSSGLFSPSGDSVLFTTGAYAYVKVAEGCSHRCSFCVIPAIRGRYRSRPVGEIVRQAERLLERGVRELVLVAQDVTAYGLDLGGGADLPRLLRRLGALGGRFRVRLLYGHPLRITDRLLETIAEVRQVCRYLDIPVQHSHPEMLRLMGRGTGGRDGMAGVVRRIRAAVPDITLRTTCLVGHPGETEERFRHLLEFVSEARFDHLGAFVYSPEDGTASARMPARVAPAAARARLGRLMLAQRRVVASIARGLTGRREVVIIENLRRPGGDAWAGRSERQAPEVDGVTFVESVPRGTQRGRFVEVEYAGRRGYDMTAVYTGDAE